MALVVEVAEAAEVEEAEGAEGAVVQVHPVVCLLAASPSSRKPVAGQARATAHLGEILFRSLGVSLRVGSPS